MKIVPSKLSPRGWALLVLVGGCLLAIPFFKSPAEPPKYMTASDAPFRKASSGNERVAPSTSVTAATDRIASATATSTSATQPASNSDLENSHRKMVVRSVAPTSDQSSPANSLRDDPSASRPQSHSVAEPSPSIARASIDTLPPPVSSARRLGEGSEVVQQQSQNNFSDVAPLNAEYPAWAKKPSLLDAVLSGKDSTPQLPDTVAARKPSSFQTWADDPSGEAIQKEDSSVDRYTPFGSLRQNASLTPQNSPSKFQWPDEDPRVAVPMPKPAERLVGRDAVIRDPERLAKPSNSTRVSNSVESGGSLGRPPAVLSSNTPGNGFQAGTDRIQSAAGDLILQPQFGQSSVGGARSTASLRKHMPPEEQLIIRQPRLK